MKKLFLALFVLSFFSLNAYAIVAEVAATESLKPDKCSATLDGQGRLPKSTENTQPSDPSAVIKKESVKNNI